MRHLMSKQSLARQQAFWLSVGYLSPLMQKDHRMGSELPAMLYMPMDRR